jgi:hypothetical protein
MSNWIEPYVTCDRNTANTVGRLWRWKRCALPSTSARPFKTEACLHQFGSSRRLHCAAPCLSPPLPSWERSSARGNATQCFSTASFERGAVSFPKHDLCFCPNPQRRSPGIRDRRTRSGCKRNCASRIRPWRRRVGPRRPASPPFRRKRESAC